MYLNLCRWSDSTETYRKNEAEEEEDGLGRENSAVHVVWRSRTDWKMAVELLLRSSFISRGAELFLLLLLLPWSQVLSICPTVITWSHASGRRAMKQNSPRPPAFPPFAPFTAAAQSGRSLVYFIVMILNHVWTPDGFDSYSSLG